MANLNKCMFIGNVGKIETRFMASGDAVTNFSIACNESWKDKNGEKQDRTEWVSCTAYKKLAEILQQYVKVGASLYVEGKMQTRKWQDKEGNDRYTTEIIVHEMQILGGKRDVGEAADDDNQSTAKAERAARREAAPAAKSFDNFEDDSIPF